MHVRGDSYTRVRTYHATYVVRISNDNEDDDETTVGNHNECIAGFALPRNTSTNDRDSYLIQETSIRDVYQFFSCACRIHYRGHSFW